MPDRAPKQPTIIVAIDFGLRRIGIASGDTLTRATHPRSTISNGPNGPDWRALERVLADTRPARIAVGERWEGPLSCYLRIAGRYSANCGGAVIANAVLVLPLSPGAEATSV